MSDISKGVLIYNEWFESMEVLPSDEYKALVNAIYHLQIHNLPPPEFTGIAKAIAAIVFPYIERRKKQSEFGRAGANARISRLGGNAASSDPSSDPSSQNKIKPNKIKSTYNKTNSNGANAPAAKGNDMLSLDELFEAAVRRSLGEASEEESA